MFALRVHGNELWKAGNHAGELQRLKHAAAVDEGNAAVLIQLARVAGGTPTSGLTLSTGTG